ncbi:MAG TPA: hypothetical protein VFU98_07100 [Microlunatus sp.]|nr:hypothetical protein [Microlunatus sp.]
MTTGSSSTAGERSRVPGYIAAGLAMAVLAVVGVFYLSSGLMAPLWAVIGLMVFWCALVVVGVVWFRRHPLRVVALPVVAVLVWYGVLTFGERVLGWTA